MVRTFFLLTTVLFVAPQAGKQTPNLVILAIYKMFANFCNREIVNMAREAGAKKVYFSSCAPPITNAHIYGIDLASPNELIAHHRSSDDIAEHIGADAVIYQSLEDLKSSCAQTSPRDTQEFEVGVFNGKYITPVPDDYFAHLERIRGESRRLKVLENAREAVRRGTAGENQVKMAANGVDVTDSGDVIAKNDGPESEERPFKRTKSGEGSTVNGDDGRDMYAERRMEHRNSQDIAIYNLNDEER